jgi:Uma2 family endonuclease
MKQAAVLSRPPAGEIVLTYDDYAELPNDGKRYEIIEGDIFVSPAPRPKHQKTIVNLCGILFVYLQDHPIGDIYLAPIDLILSPTNVVQPDLLFLGNEKLHLVSERGIEGPPDLIVEVLSPTTEKTDRAIKSRIYAQFGVPHYWLIDPLEKRLEMFRLSRGRFRTSLHLEDGASGSVKVTPDLFEGLSFDLAALWR